MKKQLLVIDDDAIIRRLFSLYLEKKGYAVTVADSGESGIEILESSRFDLITCDIIMPGMSGYDFLRAVKGNPELSHIPVVLLSATGAQDEEGVVMSLGAARMISKPCLPAELEQIIEELINGQE